MARTTRSTTQHQEQELVAPLPPRTKHASKKRKRNSLQDNDEQPATKQLRTDQSISIKDEQDTQESHTLNSLTTPPQLQNAGDVPIDPVEAQKILDILEMFVLTPLQSWLLADIYVSRSDTQGLLDRVFPLHSEASGSSTNSRQDSYSFRTLLKESSQHPLCVLRVSTLYYLQIQNPIYKPYPRWPCSTSSQSPRTRVPVHPHRQPNSSVSAILPSPSSTKPLSIPFPPPST